MLTPDSLLAHRGTMLLIDDIIDSSDTWLKCCIHPNSSRSFAFTDGRVPSWVGLEYMCQAIAALEGSVRLSQNRPITIGFVMGTRRYSAYCTHFEPTESLFIEVNEEMKSENILGVYSCKISTESGQVLAEATIKATMPDSPQEILGVSNNNQRLRN